MEWHLAWEDNSDNEIGFCIQRSMTVYNPWGETPDYFPFVTVAELPPDVTEYVGSAPLLVLDLKYRIAAVGPNDCQSEWVVLDVIAAIEGRPTDLQAEIFGSPPKVQLIWKDNSRFEAGFHIHRWEGKGEGPWLEPPDAEWPLLATVGPNAETFVDADVKPGYTYKYFVIAFSSSDCEACRFSSPSNVASVFIPMIDVTGIWSGLLTQETGAPATKYLYKMFLSQQGTTVSGTSRIEWFDDPRYYGVMQLEGVIDGYNFRFRETNILEENPPPGVWWCVKEGTLTFTPGANMDSLSGPWEAPGCLPGEIYLERENQQ